MPQIIPIELDQIKGVQEYAGIIAPIPDALEVGEPVVTARHGLAIDYAGT